MVALATFALAHWSPLLAPWWLLAPLEGGVGYPSLGPSSSWWVLGGSLPPWLLGSRPPGGARAGRPRGRWPIGCYRIVSS